MSTDSLHTIPAGTAITLAEVPVFDWPMFREIAITRVNEGDRIAAFFGVPGNGPRVSLYLVLANAMKHELRVLTTEVERQYLAITPDCPTFHYFEREIAEQCDLHPSDHPALIPVRLPSKTPAASPSSSAIATQHEFTLGPIHGGVTEAALYRFHCLGERILEVKVELGYQHRGIERKLRGGPQQRTLHYLETVAGDAAIAHALAYCELLESLSATLPTTRAEALRAIALELERLIQHTGDLGSLAKIVGYQPTANQCGQLRESLLNAMLLLSGNRLGHGLIRPAGVHFDLDASRTEQMLAFVTNFQRDMESAVHGFWQSSTIRSRFANIGTVAREKALSLGLVGVVAKACGIELDVRRHHPRGLYKQIPWTVVTASTGDVMARTQVRCLEIEQSAAWMLQQLRQLPPGEVRQPLGKLLPNALAIALVEAAHGQICHVALTDAAATFLHYKIVDPTFYNAAGLVIAARNQALSDFPLIERSFALSCAGHDL